MKDTPPVTSPPAHGQPFFMVFCPGGYAPGYCHPTRESAQEEARRLAQKTNGPAYVLRAERCIAVAASFTETDL